MLTEIHDRPEPFMALEFIDDAASAVELRKIDVLLRAAEHSCVVIQILRIGTDISVRRAAA